MTSQGFLAWLFLVSDALNALVFPYLDMQVINKSCVFLRMKEWSICFDVQLEV